MTQRAESSRARPPLACSTVFYSTGCCVDNRSGQRKIRGQEKMARRDFARAFGRVVRQRRMTQGISQEALAERADIHRNYMGMLERGECAATLDVANQVAHALGVALDGLIAEAAREYERGEPSALRRRKADETSAAPTRRRRK